MIAVRHPPRRRDGAGRGIGFVLLVALLLWLCTLPVVGLAVLPAFGAAVATGTAVVLMLVLIALSWALFRKRRKP